MLNVETFMTVVELRRELTFIPFSTDLQQAFPSLGHKDMLGEGGQA